jgi:threonine/homoserine/homoserine lactone efflux protein
MVVEFALASLLLIAVPGPDQALITRNAVVGGRTAGLRTMFGGATGLTVHAAAAALGLSALVAASSSAYTVLKVVGVAYLLYLGARMLMSSAEPGDDSTTTAGKRGRPFAQGLMSNALNPKVALFFLTFMPQFLPEQGDTLPTAVALSAIFAALYLTWFTGLLAVVERVAATLRSPKAARWVGRVTGGTLVAFAARLAAQGRH